MTTKVSPLGLRLFLEGIEVPVISASVTVQPDMPATAAIQIIPTDMGLHFLPRTLVHLFFLDTYLTDEEREEARKVGDKTAQKRASVTVEQSEMDRYDTEDFAYKLLFTGEVIGFNYKKTPTGRQLVLQCMDLSSYWDTCYQFFSDYSAGGNGLTDKYHQFVGAGSGIFDNLGGHNWVISKLINSPPRSPEYQKCEGLLGGLIHLLEAVGGLRYRNNDFKGFKGVNDFFTIAELRYGLLSMLGAIQADKSSAKLYAAKAFNEWIRNGMTSLGTLVSFRDMLNHINQYIFHNIYPNPAAFYVPGGTVKAKRTVRAGTTPLIDAAAGATAKNNLKKILVTLHKALNDIGITLGGKSEKGEDSFGLIPTIYQALQDANLQMKQEISLIEKSKGKDINVVLEDLRAIQSDMQKAVDEMPTEGGDELNKVEKAGSYAEDAAKSLYDFLGKQRARFKIEDIPVPGASFLYSQLFLPEVFFVSPPRCNVIFPDQYFDLNFSRNFMREITRLSAQGGLGLLGGGRQGSELFCSSYLAPPIKDVKGKLLLATMSQGARVLLPHEVHSGIIPKVEWITDGQRWGAKAAKKKVDKVFYLQRLANFQFFLHRWSARQLSITGIFNPNIVAGLPAVIIDRSAPSPAVVEHLEKLLRRRMLPTQFVGKIHGYTHSIGQEGGSTSIQFVYARTHRGLDDEFLGILNKEITEEGPKNTLETNPKQLATGLDPASLLKAKNEVKTSQPGSQERKHAQAKLNARVDQFTNIRKSIVRMWTEQKLKAKINVPGLGKLKKVTTSGNALLTKPLSDNLGISEDYFEKKKRSVMAKDAGVQVTIEALAGVYVIDVPEKITVEYVQILGTGRFERSGLSFEDAVRPSWFTEEVWKNDKITEAVYKPLLGTLAITDDVSLGQDQQDELLKRHKVDQTKRIEFSETNPYAQGSEGTAAVETTADGKFKYTVIPGSVEETIDGLSLVYGMMKERSGDIHQFIRDFTRRPIANIVDMLGTQNLEFGPDGKVLDPDTMIEGFHSRAFGDYNTDVQLPEKEGGTTKAGQKACGALMEGISDPASLKRPGVIGRDEPETGIRPELDPRGRARGRVRAYVEELQVSRGLLGS